MKPLRIYIDTSVLGGCFDVEFEVWSNALTRDFRSGRLMEHQHLSILSPREVATDESP